MLQIQCGEFRVKLLELEDIGSRLAGRAVARTRPTRSRQSSNSRPRSIIYHICKRETASGMGHGASAHPPLAHWALVDINPSSYTDIVDTVHKSSDREIQ